ncbi:pyridoxamine 5'-phosphate oxidase family protein [Haloglomus litoreum]|uniref:pyridoxamine 5'-phosphate oxidase family protein n=1 Tax=Haloglomus litoreum TaxID=3034026 RepID=UPI0023E846B7|nr:pyridoxamine 5'-phosphate oxidase family protein [Haloglomus sp. DT116]
MVTEDVTEFLERQGYGVLSLADEGRAYGIPVSYGYDADEGRFVLEIVNTPDSEKQRFIDASTEVSLTVLEYGDPDTWQSAIARGTLTPLAEDEVSDRLAALFFAQAEDVAKEIRWSDFEQFERRWYELDVAELSGRHGGSLTYR